MRLVPSPLVAFLSFLLWFAPAAAQDLRDPAVMAQARDLIDRQEWKAAVELYDKILEVHPRNFTSWFFRAYALHMDGHLEKAVQGYEKAAEFPEVRPNARYNLACLFALQGDRERALRELTLAKEAGFDDLALILDDPDLASIRDDERFPYPRTLQYHSLDLGEDQTLHYAIALPSDYDEKKTYPILIGMGPGSQSRTAANWGLNNMWGQDALALGWITVAPVIPPSGSWLDEEGDRAFATLLSKLRERFRPQGGRFHIAGCSNGGASACHLAIAFAKDIQSAWLVPGYPPTEDVDRLEELEDVRIRLFVGSEDGPWVRSAHDTEARLRDVGVDATLTLFEGEGHVMQSLLDGGLMERIDSEFPSLATAPIIQYHPRWSPDGDSITYYSRENGSARVYRTDVATGRTHAVTGKDQHCANPSWTPDGEIAFQSNRSGNEDLYVLYEVELSEDGVFKDGDLLQLTDHPSSDRFASFSPDGASIVFGSLRDGGPWQLYRLDLDEEGQEPVRLTETTTEEYHPKWSPDGEFIVFDSQRDGQGELYVMRRDGTDLRNLTQHPSLDVLGEFSPDGDMIAFCSNRDGDMDVYVMNRDGSSVRQLTDHDTDDFSPTWSPDGKEIAWSSSRDGDREIWIMDWKTGAKRKLIPR